MSDHVLHGVQSQLVANKEGFFYHIGDGLHYTMAHFNVTNAMLKCLTRDCPGTAIWEGNGLTHQNGHNHLPSPHFPAQLDLRRRIIERIESGDQGSYKNIFEDECSKFPKAVQSRVPWHRIYPEMKAVRLALYRHIPQSLQEVAQALLLPEYSSMSSTIDGQDNLFSKFVTHDVGVGSIIFCSSRHALFLGQVDSIACVTQDVTTNLDLQLLVIVSTAFNIALPLVYCLMEECTPLSYQAVFTALKEINPKFNPDVVVTPFDYQLKEAWNVAFPNSNILDQSAFNFIQDMIEQVKTMPIVLSEFRNVFSMCCAIPLLPHEWLHEAFRFVVEEAMQLNKFEDILPLFNFMWDKWLTGIRYETESVSATIHSLCSSNAPMIIKNMLEKYKVSSCHNIFFLIGCLADLENAVTADITQLNMGQPTSMKISSLLNTNLLRDLDDKESIQQFFDTVLRSLQPFLSSFID